MTTSTDPYALDEHPQLDDILRVLGRAIKLGIRTHVAARVVLYDAAKQTAKVQVEQRMVVRLRAIDELPPGAELRGTPPDAEAVLAPTVVEGIPVIFPGTSSAYLTVPIVPGTTGTLHVHDRSLTAWLTQGIPCDPVVAWTHALESGEFHPGLRPDTGPITPPTDLTATVVEGPIVKIGRGATIPIAKATPLVSALDAFANATPVAQDGGAAIHNAFKLVWGPPGNLKDIVAAMKGQVE